MSSHYEAPIRKPLVLGDKSYADISNDIARPVETPPDRDWWIAFSISMVIFLWGLGTFYQHYSPLSIVDGTYVLFWGGLLRIVTVWHATWSVNSLCHIWGKQPFDTDDTSKNNGFVALLTMGEGWHNNHHAHPASARHGLRWFEFDLTWQHVRLLKRFGLARKVRTARYVPGVS